MLCFLQASGAFCDYLKLVLVLKTVESDALAAGFNPVSTGLTDSFAGCLRGVGDAEDDATDGCAIMLTTKTTKSMLMIWMTMVMDVAMLMMFTVLNSISMRVKDGESGVSGGNDDCNDDGGEDGWCWCAFSKMLVVLPTVTAA